MTQKLEKMKTKATDIESKISDTSRFINTQKFNRLTKISFYSHQFISILKHLQIVIVLTLTIVGIFDIK